MSYQVTTDAEITIQLRDEQGRVIKNLEQEFYTAGSYSKRVDTSKLTSQLYFVTLSDGEDLITEKLVIQK